MITEGFNTLFVGRLIEQKFRDMFTDEISVSYEPPSSDGYHKYLFSYRDCKFCTWTIRVDEVQSSKQIKTVARMIAHELGEALFIKQDL